MKRWPLAIVATLALTLLLAACPSETPESLPVYHEIPAFSLTDQMGRPFSREALNGKVVLSNFIFTNCKEFCPTLTPRMAQVQASLKEDGLLGSRALLLSFSVDPEHDTPDILRSYAESHGADNQGWLFLTGPPETAQQVITDGLKLGYSRVNESNKHVHPDGSIHIHEYDVLHTNRVALLDKAGWVRAYYDGAADWDLDMVLRDIRQLLDQDAQDG